MNKIFGLIIIICGLVLTTGCQRGTKKPEGLPELIPCVLNFKTDAGPLTEATVELFAVPANRADRWLYQGKTDDKGKAVISTMSQYPGIPAGKYCVVISKVRSDTTKLDNGKTHVKEFSQVDLKYTEKEKTPLSIEVQQSAIDQSFDLGQMKETLINDATI